MVLEFETLLKLHLIFQVFTSEGKFINTFGSRGKENNKFISPCGVASNVDGELFVSDFRNSRIHVI